MATHDGAGSAFDPRALAQVLDDFQPADGYARGALDVLHLLGLVEHTAGTAKPANAVTGMVLDSLRAHLTDGVRVGLRWDDLDGASLRGVDVLRAIEAARTAAVDDATPGRIVRAVQSVIKGRRGGEDLYLMQYDRHGGRYQPIGGKQDPEDVSPEAAMRREVMEELCLDALPGPDVLSLEPIGPHWHTSELSATYGILTAYEMRFFNVTALRFPLLDDEDTRWLTRAELARRQAGDGRPISPVYEHGLGGLEVLDALPAVVEVPVG